MPIEAGLLEILACPACHAPLTETFPASIPVLLVDEARRPA
ncbi:Trm112 family protein [Streptomyces sp. NPDC002454]